MGEPGSQQVSGVVGLSLDVIDRKVKLGDLDRQAKLCKSIDDPPDLGWRSQRLTEVSLHADALNRRAF